MDIVKAILTFVLQSENYPESAVNRELGNRYRGYINSVYKGCDTAVGLYSMGYIRYNITYIGFLSHGQSVKKGIYPVMLYFRKIKKLIFAYGVSANETPDVVWDWELMNVESCTTLKELFSTRGWDAYDDYFDSFVYSDYDMTDFVEKYRDVDITKSSVIPEAASFPFEKDVDTLIEHFNLMFGAPGSVTPAPAPVPTPAPIPVPLSVKPDFSIDEVIKHIASTGLIYSPYLVKRFALSLMTKPFVILSGLAGSGKTQLALAFAKALVKNDDQICIVAVGADWTNREPLLGYPNALDSTKYVKPESGVLDLLMEATQKCNKDKPYFLILDEMNMSYVERYFADFLSGMESKEPIRLWNHEEEDGVKKSIKLPDNLYIIGTINVDETTYMFSPKVLDRASVIEFKISVDEMTSFLKRGSSAKPGKPAIDPSTMAESFVERSRNAKIEFGETEIDEAVEDTLISFFKELKSVNAEFGYRSAIEIYRYIVVALGDGGAGKIMDDDMILDSAIVQKLLPKLHGSRKKLTPALRALWGLCCPGKNLDEATCVPSDAKYPLSADKILRMFRYAVDNGFASFSEA